MSRRLTQTLLVAGVAFYMTLIVWGNVFDYGANFAFVQHVLSMDTIPADNPLRDRAIQNPTLHHACYATIIVWELAAAVLCWYGVYRLLAAVRGGGPEFEAARLWASWGLVVGLCLWLVAFLCVGGEWFQMWQSPTWNGQEAAFRMFAVTGLVLIFLQYNRG